MIADSKYSYTHCSELTRHRGTHTCEIVTLPIMCNRRSQLLIKEVRQLSVTRTPTKDSTHIYRVNYMTFKVTRTRLGST